MYTCAFKAHTHKYTYRSHTQSGIKLFVDDRVLVQKSDGDARVGWFNS